MTQAAPFRRSLGTCPNERSVPDCPGTHTQKKMDPRELAAFKADLWTISRSEEPRLVVESLHPASRAMTEIHRLRAREYESRGASYLCAVTGETLLKNQVLDQRSLHLAVWRASTVIGALRLTTAPFELVTETSLSSVDDDYAHHMEFGRLVMTGDAGFRAPAEKLMASGCLMALDHGKAGVIAMCRPAQARLFERYGLARIVEQPLVLPQRDHGTYWLLASSWQSMASPIARIATRIREQHTASQRTLSLEL